MLGRELTTTAGGGDRRLDTECVLSSAGTLEVGFDDDSTVVAGAPVLRGVERTDLDTVRDGSGGEHEVELPSRGRWHLSRVMEGRHAEAVPGELFWPRVCLASVGCSGPTTRKPSASARSKTVSYRAFQYLLPFSP